MKKSPLFLLLASSWGFLNACGGGGGTLTPPPPTATHFSVSAPVSATAGTAFNFTVTALDASNNTVATYSGTVHFTSTDSQAVLSANSTLTNGTGTFSATLKTTGSQTITATDTITASITGSSNSITVSTPVPAATHFSVSAPASATAGTAFNFTVTALDASNNTVTTYSGTVHFTSTDSQAVLPANSTLTNGTGTFSATLKTAGSQTITATDTVTASITGSSNSVTVSSPVAAATHFSVSAPASATAGTAFNFTVAALDASNNTVATYSGTVHFTSTDSQAVLPANSMLTNGTGTFSATLKSSGSQTITATDTVTASITGTSNSITVSSPAPAATHFSVTGPASAAAGTAFNFTVTALDASNNTVPAYSGTVRFTSTDSQAVLPANSTLTNGTGTFSATLKTSGNQTITAMDTVTASITGSSNAISVSAAAATHFSVSAPASVTAGTAFNFTVTALDASNNTVTTYSGTVHFTSTDAQAVLPANSALTNGSGTFSATLKTAGSQTITATDTVTASITGSSNSISISAASAANPVPLINQPLSPDATAPGGTAFTLTVNGTGFVSGSVVNWNGKARATTFVSKSRLTAAILGSDIATASTASVTVTNPAPGGGTSNVAFFEITTPTSWADFSAPADFFVGSSPSSVTVGDFNNDGKLDLTVVIGSNNVSILLGNGDGTFQPAVNYSVGQGPESVAVGDFNNDAKLDLAVANNGSNNVSILLGNGDGTFQPTVNYSVGQGPNSVAVGDFNRDGKLDLAITNIASNNVSILLGNGDGTFQPAVDYSTGTNPSSVAVGDLNGDGKLDLAVANNGSGVSILLGNGDGTFQPAVDFGAGQSPGSVLVADFNNDGKLDLAVVNHNFSNSVSILLGNGDGSFQPAVNYSVEQNPESVAVGDLNGDGKLDLAIADAGTAFTGGVTVLLGNGDGTFQPTVDFATGQGAGSLAVGDFNGDGKLDLAVTETLPFANNAVSILLQTEPVSGPNATLSPTSMFFECRSTIAGCECFALQGTTVTLSNFGSETLDIKKITIASPFSQVNNCGTSLEPGRSCSIKISWSDITGGSTLSVFDNASGSPQTVFMFGDAFCTPLSTGNANSSAEPASCVGK